MDGEGDTDAFHLRKFKCFPPGDFPGAYVSSRAAKEVAKGPEMEQKSFASLHLLDLGQAPLPRRSG